MTPAQPVRPVRPVRLVHPEDLASLRRFAWLLDNQFRVPGTNFRFGLDALVGLVPGFGDFAGAIASLVFLVQAVRMGAPRAVVGRMIANVAAETLVGVIPGIGDFFDAAFKANNRNMKLLERLAVEPERTHQASRRFLVWAAIGIAALLLVIGIAAVALGIMIMNAILHGRGPLQ